MMRTMGWWFVWQKRRDIDDFRLWFGRNNNVRRIYVSIDEQDEFEGQDYPNREYLLPSTTFEDRLLDILDFGEAWPLVSVYQKRVLLLTAKGLNDIQIGKILGRSQNAIAKQKSLGRQVLREACAVTY